MFRTPLAALLMLTALVGSASAASLYSLPDPQLEVAAERLRQKDYQGALNKARLGKEGAIRDFVMGEAAFRLERPEEALPFLTAAAAGFPLLADYALLRRAQSLAKLENYSEALASARTLLQDYPESILLREAHFLAADSQFRLGQTAAARETFRAFVEKYPSGNDSLKATYLAALALLKGGETARGAAELRTFWLSHPASPLADEAGKALQELPPGLLLPPTSDELFRRALALYDAKKYSDSVNQMESLLQTGVSPELAGRIRLKLGQTLFRLRRFAEAEKCLNQIDAAILKKEQQEELAYWRARLFEKNGNVAEAYSAYLRIATDNPASPYADNALYDAAAAMKSLGRPSEAGQLFSRLVQNYPDSTYLARSGWEAGWERLTAGDAKAAVEHFQRLADVQETSEQGLFWLAKALEAAGEQQRAMDVRTRLLREYPYGYYAVVATRGTSDSPVPAIAPLNLTTELPLPQGMDRIKALITFGLAPEARQELSRLKSKGGTGKQRTMARLYLEMGDYAAAMRLFQKSAGKGSTDGVSSWGITYPVPFREEVARHARESRLNLELVYSVMRAESSFSPSALSPAGAMGLMQLMPSTAKMMMPNSSLTTVTSRLTVPDYNISLGTRHLRDLLNQYGGDEVLAVAAYNAGAGNVNRWIKSFGTTNREAFIEQIPFPETRAYVKKVLTGAAIYRGLYGKGLFSPHSSALSTSPRSIPSRESEELEEALPMLPAGATTPAAQS